MTFSIVGRDPITGDLGVAVASKFLAVGSVVPWVRAGVGAVATQSYANVRYGPNVLDLLAGGTPSAIALDRAVGEDNLREERQVGVVDAAGRAATHTGDACFAWAGGRTGDNFAAQGNILAGPGVVEALSETFIAGERPLPELLVACLRAGDAAGGDRRGRESAALYVARAGAGYGGGNDRWIDLRVDDHEDPIAELARLLDLQRLYLDRPGESDLVPLEEALAVEIRESLERLGAEPGGRLARLFSPMTPGKPILAEPRRAIGQARQTPASWSDDWQRALNDWMAVENLEERAAASGWIDPRVLEVLRTRSST